MHGAGQREALGTGSASRSGGAALPPPTSHPRRAPIGCRAPTRRASGAAAHWLAGAADLSHWPVSLPPPPSQPIAVAARRAVVARLWAVRVPGARARARCACPCKVRVPARCAGARRQCCALLRPCPPARRGAPRCSLGAGPHEVAAPARHRRPWHRRQGSDSLSRWCRRAPRAARAWRRPSVRLRTAIHNPAPFRDSTRKDRKCQSL